MSGLRRSIFASLICLLLAGDAVSAERYGLLIGINEYPDFSARMQLHGCENDVELLRRELTGRFQFDAQNIKILLSRDATRQNILDGLDWLKRVSAAGDVCLFYYSGHGSQLPDDNGDESGEDGLDEILCPSDFKLTSPKTGANYIRDDELNRISGEFADRRFVAIYDCCHSGTGLRSIIPACRGKYLFYEGAVELTRTRALAEKGIFFETASYTELQGGAGGLRGNETAAGFEYSPARQAATEALGAALIAAARANELAAETDPIEIDGARRVHGALTVKLISALRGAADADNDGSITFAELRGFLEQPLNTSRGTQHPQVEVGEQLLRRGIFETQHPRLETPAPTAAPVAEADRPPAAAGATGLRPLAVAIAALSELQSAAELDAAATAQLKLKIGRMLSAQPARFTLVGGDEPFEAYVLCSARKNGDVAEYQLAVIDGSARLLHQAGAGFPENLVADARKVLTRLHGVRNLLRIEPPRQSQLQLAVELDGGGYQRKLHDPVRFKCRANQSGYLTLLNVDCQGSLNLLFPNRWSGGEGNWEIAAQDTVQFPTAAMNFEIPVVEPLGEELVFALLTPRPLDLRALGLDPNGELSGVEGAAATRSIDGILERALVARNKDGADGPAGASGSYFSFGDSEDWAVARLKFSTSY